MSFTWQGTYFFNGEAFDEVEHAKALGNGIVNFIGGGLEYSVGAVTNGKGINNGVPFILGRNGEMQGVSANYTGYLVLKTTLNGANSTTILMESATIPESTDNIKYFAIYKLENGEITQDFRHIEYIKSFEVKNVGGSNFIFVLNGYESEPFEASVLAGNRTLINEVDIGYDDAIHATTPLQDILKDLFDKSQALIGSDKPFILSFLTETTSEGTGYNSNIGAKLFGLVEDKYGFIIPSTSLVSFKMEVSTANGGSNELYTECNKCSVWNEGFYFEWEFDYDNWANIIVRDVKGLCQNPNSPEIIANLPVAAYYPFTLSESIYNFSSISVYVQLGSITRYHKKIPISYTTSLYMDSASYNVQSDEVSFSNLAFVIDSPEGTEVSLSGSSTNYVNYCRIISGQSTFVSSTECGILKMAGEERIHPRGTTHSNKVIDGKIYRVTTLPSDEEIIKELPVQE